MVNEDSWQPYPRYTYQYFGWYRPPSNPDYHLRLFRNGDNHTFEQETHYDGYDGEVYASHTSNYWNSNLPRAYLDTQFNDNYGEPNICVGTADATELQSGQWYWYWIRTWVNESYYRVAATDRISIVSQRGYRNPSWCYSTWCVFPRQTHINKYFRAGLVAPSPGWQHYWPYQT